MTLDVDFAPNHGYAEFHPDFVAGAPADFGGGAVILSAPPAPFVPPEAVGAPLSSAMLTR
jgi:hypothetical protein